MNAVRFVDIETSDKILSHYQSNYSKWVSISESHRGLIQGVENLLKKGAPGLKKVYSYKSTPPFGHHDLL